MKKKLVIFDLDGTLLNSIYAIANATNKALEYFGLKTYDAMEYNNFVGNGLRKLVEIIIEKEGHDKSVDEIMEVLLDIYNKEYDYNLKPYEGIEKLLYHLTINDIKFAVITNKDHDLAVKSCMIDELKPYSFCKIIGVDPEKLDERKPSNVNVLRLRDEFKLKNEDILFVGDMLVDRDTAKNSNVDFVYCNWGFGKVKGEVGIDENTKVDTVDEIIEKYL
ncbi:HAD family hydrolase [Streptobacillus felis]|uniref:HAD family hydrolase n=1 Tax=Streptobacillus felis TaxID=1384509 RepID=A0A7Z0PE39_9FUSO|nr:HAD family hydrolase [Streptobacillus felis]NYV27536.1 HAD family hydrolase [Streptobacillus felis]